MENKISNAKKTLVLIVLVSVLTSIACTSLKTYKPTTVPQAENSQCLLDVNQKVVRETRSAISEDVKDLLHGINQCSLGECEENPALSCDQICKANSSSVPGDYWLQTCGGDIEQVYCAMDRPCGCTVKNSTNDNTRGGLTYTRWGRSSCPSTTGTELLYDGIMAGSRFTESGGANHLCLPREGREYLEYVVGKQQGALVGTEYEIWNNFIPMGFSGDNNHDAPCAMCYAPSRIASVMIPAKVNCPSSWTREYYGYLMSTHTKTEYRSTFVCVDVNAEALPDSDANTNPDLIYFTEIICNGIPCEPDEDGKEIPCVVCTK